MSLCGDIKCMKQKQRRCDKWWSRSWSDCVTCYPLAAHLPPAASHSWYFCYFIFGVLVISHLHPLPRHTSYIQMALLNNQINKQDTFSWLRIGVNEETFVLLVGGTLLCWVWCTCECWDPLHKTGCLSIMTTVVRHESWPAAHYAHHLHDGMLLLLHFLVHTKNMNLFSD